ncbi:MAG: LysE family translocator [Acidimicrobiales bacterium]|nr:LysE family translocator [Hyphomonadaceae bacterium]RZV44295.1 MAG: LysE family translocator [Acidimicrobiales bacterium]
MDGAIFGSLLGFAAITSITPGPNNFMQMSSGALFGFRRTIPHIAGIQIGFASLMAACVFGLGAVVDQFPWLVTIVKVIGAVWLVWLALKFFKAALETSENLSLAEEDTSARPLKFYEAAFFQWANPKALIMGLVAAGLYVEIAQSTVLRALIICSTFMAVGIISSTTWTLAGHTLNRYMSSGRSAVFLNAIMGLLLVATAAIILIAKAQ